MSEVTIQPNQMEFLTELKKLFGKYHINSVYYCREEGASNCTKLCFSSNGQLLVLDWTPRMTHKPDGMLNKANYEYWSPEGGFRVVGEKKIVKTVPETVTVLEEDADD